MTWMNDALDLANNARPSPNPRVGCIITRNNATLGKGYHRAQGMPHAEVEAINDAKQKNNSLRGATMYVTLEPCCHVGMTPPCTEAILREGIQKVVIAISDPDPRVSGRGIRILRNNGIEVEIGEGKEKALHQNKDFFHFHKTGLPLVSLKIATTLDGRIADSLHRSRWITGIASREFAQRLRAEHDAILVGRNTVNTDNPRLTLRKRFYDLQKQPLRVILDSKLSVDPNAQVFADSNVIVITTKNAPTKKKRILEKKKIQLQEVSGDHISTKIVLTILAKRNIHSVLIEGGGQVMTSFLKQRQANKIYWFIAPKILGGPLLAIHDIGIQKLANAIKLRSPVYTPLGADMLVEGSL